VRRFRFVDDFISSFLRDYRSCRLPGGECSIPDQFRTLFFEDFIPAQGVIFCSPVYLVGRHFGALAIDRQVFSSQSVLK
jgi:hypothetical protein